MGWKWLETLPQNKQGMALVVCSRPHWRKGSRGVEGRWASGGQEEWGQSDGLGRGGDCPFSSHPPHPANACHFIHLSWKNTSRETLATAHVCTVRTSQCFPSVSVGRKDSIQQVLWGGVGAQRVGACLGGSLGTVRGACTLSLTVSQAFRTSQGRPW